MAETQETHAAVIAEMRRGTKLPGYWCSCDVNKILRYHADRAEAAHEREVAQLREALGESCAYAAVALRTGIFHREHLEKLVEKAKAALAATETKGAQE